MNAIFMDSSSSLVAQPRLDVHQPVLVEERDTGSVIDDNPAQLFRLGLFPLAAQPVAIDPPGSSVILRRLLALQRDGGAVLLEADAVGAFVRALAIEQRLARQEPAERRRIEPGAMRPGERGIRPDLREMPGIQHQPEQMAEIADAEPRLAETIGAMDEDEIEGRHDKSELPAIAPGEEAAGWQCHRSGEAVREKPGPPQVTVARAEAGARIGLRALLDPCGRDDLSVAPFALVQIEQRETREVARAHLERVRRID